MISETIAQHPWLWTLAWQSSICLAAGLIGSYLLRRWAARAHQILLLGLIATVLVPAVSEVVQWNQWGLFAAERAVPAPGQDLPVLENNLTMPAPPIARNAVESASAAESPRTVSAPAAVGFRWTGAIPLLWPAASGVLLLRLVGLFLLGRRVVARSAPIEEPRITRTVAAAKDRLAIPAEVAIRTGSQVRSPVIWCWGRRPTLLMPTDSQGNDRLDWMSVVCHELAHWRRRDHVCGLWAELMVCVTPWQPLAWWARRRLMALSEEACDDWVVASGQGTTRYARTLLGLIPQGQHALIPAMVTTGPHLATRVRRIIEDRCGNPRAGGRWSLAAVALAGSMAIGVGFAQTRPASSSAMGKDSAPSWEQLHKILDAMLHHDRAMMPIAMHVNVDLYNLDAPAETQHDQKYVFEQRLDGRRLDALMNIHRLRDGQWRHDQVNRRVFTGDQFIYRQQTVGDRSHPVGATLYPRQEATQIMAYSFIWGSALLGYLPTDVQPIATILKNAEGVALLERMEDVDGSACHVIEGRTDHGTYKLWIDPERDYRLRRAIVDKGPGHPCFGKTISAQVPEDQADRTMASIHIELSDVRLERIGDRFIPVAETETTTIRWVSGRESHSRIVVTRSQIDRSPDFERLGAFVMDEVPEGSRLTSFDLDDPTYAYEWHDGRAVSVAPDGGTILGQIRFAGHQDLSTILLEKRSFRADFLPVAAGGEELGREKTRHSRDVKPALDGTFRVTDIPAGRYRLFLSLTELGLREFSPGRFTPAISKLAETGREFFIPDVSDPSRKTVDLGVIEMAIENATESTANRGAVGP